MRSVSEVFSLHNYDFDGIFLDWTSCKVFLVKLEGTFSYEPVGLDQVDILYRSMKSNTGWAAPAMGSGYR